MLSHSTHGASCAFQPWISIPSRGGRLLPAPPALTLAPTSARWDPPCHAHTPRNKGLAHVAERHVLPRASSRGPPPPTALSPPQRGDSKCPPPWPLPDAHRPPPRTLPASCCGATLTSFTLSNFRRRAGEGDSYLLQMTNGLITSLTF